MSNSSTSMKIILITATGAATVLVGCKDATCGNTGEICKKRELIGETGEICTELISGNADSKWCQPAHWSPGTCTSGSSGTLETNYFFGN